MLAGVLMPLITHAQIKGVVTDSLTHEPLMYITVQYEKRRLGNLQRTYLRAASRT